MSKGRIAKWDNLKLFMMLCVVIGHTIYYFIDGENTILKGIYFFIYTFHMPVFIYLTGMFSKNAIRKKKYERVIQYLFIYLVIKFLDYLGHVLSSQVSRDDLFHLQFLQDIKLGLGSSYKGFHLFWEDGPGWYALAVAVFLLVTIVLQRYDAKTIMIVSIIFGCFAGLDNHMGDHFVSMRIAVFYPVFLAGFYTHPDRLLEKEKQWNIAVRIIAKIGCICVLLLNLGLSLRYAPILYSHINLLKGKTNYITLGLGAYGVILRFVTYMLWFVLVVVIIELCPKRHFFWSWFGERTMSVFIWHKFLLVVVLNLFFGKYYLKYYLPHYYAIGAVCIAVMVFIITAYLPSMNIEKRLKHKNYV